jgi:hypothetical protein
MTIPSSRFSIWTGDGGFSAYDAIIESLDEEILGGLRMAEEDGSSLNYLTAHLHALATLGEGSGGYARTNLDIADLERRTIAVYRDHRADYPQHSPEEAIEEMAFIESLFSRLRALDG